MLKFSPHQYTTAKTNTLGQRFLTDRVPFRFVDAPDNRVHIVQEGERMEDIASRYYARFETVDTPAAGFAWLIRDFQPVTIIDPTIKLKAGQRLYIPSDNFVAQRIFDDRRRDL